jgi:hypothetical protein
MFGLIKLEDLSARQMGELKIYFEYMQSQQVKTVNQP